VAKRRGGLDDNPLDVFDFIIGGNEVAVAPPPETQPTTYPLTDIRPDPHQPRRILRENLGTAVTEGRLSPRQAIEELIRCADQGDQCCARTLQGLRSLAASIEKHGLIHPINLREVNGQLLIEEGERRYWAHWLLVLQGKEAFAAIEARVISTGNVRARQLIENWQREDLSAVERALGLCLLRLEMSGKNVNHGSHFWTNLVERARSRSWKAGGLVPWQRVEQELGISRRARLYLLKVLDLHADALTLAARYRMPERVLRPVAEKLADRPNLQVQALEAVAISYEQAQAQEDDSLRMGPADVKKLVDRLLRSENQAKSEEKEYPGQHAQALRRSLRSTLRTFRQIQKELATEQVIALVSTPQGAEVGALAAELEPLIRDLAARWRTAQESR